MALPLQTMPYLQRDKIRSRVMSPCLFSVVSSSFDCCCLCCMRISFALLRLLLTTLRVVRAICSTSSSILVLWLLLLLALCSVSRSESKVPSPVDRTELVSFISDCCSRGLASSTNDERKLEINQHTPLVMVMVVVGGGSSSSDCSDIGSKSGSVDPHRSNSADHLLAVHHCRYYSQSFSHYPAR